jgi:hypothetical protein
MTECDVGVKEGLGTTGTNGRRGRGDTRQPRDAWDG